MSREPHEPTPAHGDEVPDAVLDELRQAFTGTPSAGSQRPVEPDPTELGDPRDRPDDHTDFTLADLTLGDLTLDDLPLAEVDDVRSLSDESGAGFHSGGDDSVFAEPWVVEVPPADPSDPSGASVPASPFSLGNGASAGSSSGTTPARTTIVIGGDDGLPDAVYLDEGELPAVGSDRDRRPAGGAPAGDREASGERSTIVIGDELEASGAFDAVAVPSRSMDPRVRARRIAVKRAQGRKRLLLVGGIGGAVLVVVAVLAVFSSSLFAVERVDVQGAPYTSERYGDRLQAVVDDVMGEPVLLVDTAAAEDALEALPWVERAFVTTDFPDRVLIDVRERQPLATFQGSDGRYRVIDRDGFVLDVLAGRPASYLLIDGIGPDLEPASSAGAAYSAAAQLAGALPAEIRDLTVGATLDPTTGDLGLVLQVVPGVDTEGTSFAESAGSAGSAGETGDGDAEGEGEGQVDGQVDGEADDGSAEEPTRLVTVRIGSFIGLDGKLARLLQLLRDGIGDATNIDVSTDDVIG